MAAKALRIPTFGGMVPRAGRRALKNHQAQAAANVRLTSEQLEALRDVALVNDPGVTNVLSIFKLTQEGLDYWLGWPKEVDAVKGPIAGDETNRTYYTGDNEPRVTDFDLATSSPPYPADFYVLGVTPPLTAASVSHAGGAGEALARSFVYTFVTPWGEESAPSPASAVVDGKVDGTWTIGATTPMDTAPPNSFAISAASWAAGIATVTVPSTFGLRVGEEISVAGVNPAGYNTASAVITEILAGPARVRYAVAADPGAYVAGGTLERIAPHNTTGMMKRIYWTETTQSGTEYRFVKEVAVATTNTTVDGATLSGEELPSEDWLMPPVAMRGLMVHPSGALVGFDKNELLFSEPYKPYAWPPRYRLTAKNDVVGIGIYGTTVVLCTKGIPQLAVGVDPESMTLADVDFPWPCLAKRGIVNLGYGVMYPAPEGLALIGMQGPELVTAGLYTKEEWKKLKPDTFRAGAFSNRYVVSYDPGDGNRLLLIIDREPLASVTTSNKHCDVVFGDPQTGKLYIVTSHKIFEWDADSAPRMMFDWMSKEIVAPEVFNPGAAQVDCDFSLTPEEQAALTAARNAVIAANEAIIAANDYDIEGSMAPSGEIEVAGVSFDEAPTDNPEQLQFQLWINNQLKFTKQVTASRAFRLPAGFKADALAVRLTGNVKVLAVVVADSMTSLRHA